jgi:serine/threonine protein kinase
VSGYHPFDPSGRDSPQAILANVRSNRVAWIPQRWAHVSIPVKDLIMTMMSRDPALRPSATAVLAHPWLLPEAVAAPCHDLVSGCNLGYDDHIGDFTVGIPLDSGGADGQDGDTDVPDVLM